MYALDHRWRHWWYYSEAPYRRAYKRRQLTSNGNDGHDGNHPNASSARRADGGERMTSERIFILHNSSNVEVPPGKVYLYDGNDPLDTGCFYRVVDMHAPEGQQIYFPLTTYLTILADIKQRLVDVENRLHRLDGRRPAAPAEAGER